MKATISDRIKELRTALALSQTEFAYQTGISHSLLTKIEAGDNPPTNKVIRKILEKWNVTEQWLSHGKGELKFEASTKSDNPWKEEAYVVLKSENKRLWEMIDDFRSGRVSFLLPVKGTAPATGTHG